MVWSEAPAGAEFDNVFERVMTFAASTKRSDGTPIDQRTMVMATIAAVAWSNDKELKVLDITLRCIEPTNRINKIRTINRTIKRSPLRLIKRLCKHTYKVTLG
jgi:hypothetical protein